MRRASKGQYTWPFAQRLSPTPLPIEHVRQVTELRQQAVLRVIDAEVAVLVRGLKAADGGRAEPGAEVLRAGVGVLQGSEEIETALQGFLVAAQPRRVAGGLRHPAGLRQAEGRLGAADLRRQRCHLSRAPGHEAARPVERPRLGLGVL